MTAMETEQAPREAAGRWRPLARIPRFKSLRLHLLSWVVVPLVGLAAVNLWTSRHNAVETANLVTDRMLLGSARAIAEQVTASGGIIDATVPPAAIEMFDTGDRDSVYYRVQTSGGRLLSGYPELPAVPGTTGTEKAFRGQKLRLRSFSHPVVGAGADSPVLVTVGVTLEGRNAMVRRLWLSAFAQQAALVLIAGFFVLIGLRRGLEPLLRLRDIVRSRSNVELEPVSVPEAQTEIRPLIEALNGYMDRVRAQMAAQRRFVANAAHQLRTPLALLATQTAYAQREMSVQSREEALTAIQASTRRLARLAEQLLTLSRAEPGSRRPRSDEIDLTDACREVLERLAPVAVDRGIDLGLEAEGPVLVTGDRTMLGEMIVNLVDNALRHGRPNGNVTVEVAERDGRAALTVADDGPGIPEAEREHVFERFYRMAQDGVEGSGLGLAIVREVVENASGQVTLSEGVSGGLVVSVVLPLRRVRKRSSSPAALSGPGR